MTLVEAVVAALWLGPFLLFLRLGRKSPRLTSHQPRREAPVSVIIPARNESATIDTVLGSIVMTSHSAVEVIVVDDRSTDDTAEKVRAWTARDERITLIEGEELPPGWYGKPWACHQGHLAASADILLFTDADTIHDKDLLSYAVGALQDQGADLVTVAPHQLCIGFWERLIMPQVWAILGARYHPRAVNRSRSSSTTIANGQFIMVRRASYEAAGTHEAVRGSVAEDLALAQQFRSAGQELYFAFATELMQTRMYRSLSELVEGWSKNIYLGGRQSLKDHPVLRAMLPAAFALTGILWLAPLMILGLAAVLGEPGWALTGGIATVLSLLFWALVSAGMSIPPWYGMLYPLGVGGFLYIAALSVSRGIRGVQWRGRVYHIAEQPGRGRKR